MVTLTGADDSVRPSELVEISKKYPFVEWGILMGTISGVERFPSEKWLNQLVQETTGTDIRLSAHLCDDFLDSMFYTGSFPVIAEHAKIFQRCQLNFHGKPISNADWSAIIRTFTESPKWQGEVIVQLDGVNDDVLDDLLDHQVRASGLYDCSHGNGVKPETWPTPNSRWNIGYAGGLGPETITSDLEEIKKVVGEQSFWIDMETKLRTVPYAAPLDVFDLEKCEAVLQAVSREFPGTETGTKELKYFKWDK